jgi:uncharacterized protein YbbC (DUF1343 family)
MTVKTGLEVLRHDGYKPLRGLRVGLFTNPSAIDRNLDSAYNIFLNDERINLVSLFTPEHGLYGDVPAGESINSAIDPRSGLPVYSMYGETYCPTPDMLKDIDVMVCDVQDIGVRYYTYTWTISHILEAAGAQDVSVVLLDRPNPLGGISVDGPLLETHLSSLVGRYPIPVCHGMSLGELTWMINETWNPQFARLSIVPCEGWERQMSWVDTKLLWVPPSPNMPHLSTLLQYAGACLLEGTNLSEGRGTALPFEIVGAPFIDSLELTEVLKSQDWYEVMGVGIRPHTFEPTASKWAGEYCHGVQVYVTNPQVWRPIHVWLGIIATVSAMYPENFQWIPPVDDSSPHHFDRLIGTDRIRHDIDAGSLIEEIAEDWVDARLAFRQQRRPFLLYD